MSKKLLSQQQNHATNPRDTFAFFRTDSAAFPSAYRFANVKHRNYNLQKYVETALRHRITYAAVRFPA